MRARNTDPTVPGSTAPPNEGKARRNGTLRRAPPAAGPRRLDTPTMTTTDALHLAATALAVDNQDGDTLDRIAAQLDAEDESRHARLTGPKALAEAAAWYCAQGVPVFPLVPRLKAPLTTRGFKDASTDPDQVTAWWRATPQANIGMPTGVVADVIDIDGPRGVLAIAGNAHQPDYVTRLREQAIGIVSTPRSGGLHYWVPPTSRKNTAGKLLPGVDTRGTGGYVVLPPSVTDEHGAGRRYTWIRPLVLP